MSDIDYDEEAYEEKIDQKPISELIKLATLENRELHGKYLTEHHLDMALAALPMCLRDRNAMHMHLAMSIFFYQLDQETRERWNKEGRQGKGGKVEQVYKTAQKLLDQLTDRATTNAIMGAAERYGDVTNFCRIDDMVRGLPGNRLREYVEMLKQLKDAPLRIDPRTDWPLVELVVDLAELYREATGEQVAVPYYNDITGEVAGDDALKFLRFFDWATADLFGKEEAPSRSTLRHILTDAPEGAENRLRAPRSRLC